MRLVVSQKVSQTVGHWDSKMGHFRNLMRRWPDSPLRPAVHLSRGQCYFAGKKRTSVTRIGKAVRRGADLAQRCPHTRQPSVLSFARKSTCLLLHCGQIGLIMTISLIEF